MPDVELWKGLNVDGDTVTVWRSESGDFPIAFNNDEEGYAGATVIPKEAILVALAASQSEGEENGR